MWERRACGEISRTDYTYALTCKSTPVLVEDGCFSRMEDAHRLCMFRIESRILGFTTKTRCLPCAMEIFFPFSTFFLLWDYRYVGHWGWHRNSLWFCFSNDLKNANVKISCTSAEWFLQDSNCELFNSAAVTLIAVLCKYSSINRLWTVVALMPLPQLQHAVLITVYQMMNWLPCFCL